MADAILIGGHDLLFDIASYGLAVAVADAILIGGHNDDQEEHLEDG